MDNPALVAFALLLLVTTLARAGAPCAYDAAAMLALDEAAFDQDLANGGGGWRAIANTPGCELAAGDLLATYRSAHPKASGLLAWHEGQMRATAGQYERAIELLDQDRKPEAQDKAGWNHYVDATVAFLRGDSLALLKARAQLAAVPYPEGAGLPPLKDGHFEVPVAAGQPAARMRWPPNIDVVDGLVACYGKPYAEAYGAACRAHAP